MDTPREEAEEAEKPPPFGIGIGVIWYLNFQHGILGQSIRKFTTSMVCRSHFEEGRGKNLPLLPSVENKRQFLAMMPVYFRSVSADPFCIVRHQLLKK
ncbi:cytochrome c oxidase subunit 7C, mitochondrial-like [Apodemus sylvaticus]|uniref:cytochrome c oxidase subunit 7C, mitochondrial-like n=1 Tax=Apodemus sylvaticus TaxID=10129 RepID=UPI002244E086|nr:cytochrome c oxidase subunit 7C, mitochondrial-like [Apodemus sylvaticus]